MCDVRLTGVPTSSHIFNKYSRLFALGKEYKVGFFCNCISENFALNCVSCFVAYCIILFVSLYGNKKLLN